MTHIITSASHQHHHHSYVLLLISEWCVCVHIMLLMAILLRTVLVFLDFATERGLSGFSLLCSPYYSFFRPHVLARQTLNRLNLVNTDWSPNADTVRYDTIVHAPLIGYKIMGDKLRQRNLTCQSHYDMWLKEKGAPKIYESPRETMWKCRGISRFFLKCLLVTFIYTQPYLLRTTYLLSHLLPFIRFHVSWPWFHFEKPWEEFLERCLKVSFLITFRVLGFRVVYAIGPFLHLFRYFFCRWNGACWKVRHCYFDYVSRSLFRRQGCKRCTHGDIQSQDKLPSVLTPLLGASFVDARLDAGFTKEEICALLY